MAALISRVVGGSRLWSHTSKLGKFFVMPMALSTPIFNKKYDQPRIVELPKLPTVVTLLHWNF